MGKKETRNKSTINSRRDFLSFLWGKPKKSYSEDFIPEVKTQKMLMADGTLVEVNISSIKSKQEAKNKEILQWLNTH